jgi:hypothetical protein
MGEMMCKMTQGVGSQKRKGQMQMWTEYEETVNQQWYLEVLTRLRESVRRKRPELWPDKWILRHDNAPAHDALRVREFLAKKSITKMDHPPYSPYLVPCDFLALSKIKKCPEGTKICRHSGIQRNVTLLRVISENDLQDYFRQWHHRLTKCIASQGKYLKVTAAASAQVSKFCFHRAIPGIKLSHLVLARRARSMVLMDVQ